MLELWTSTANVAAEGTDESGWFDIGKKCLFLDVLRSNTGGTYVLEVDWSMDEGSTTSATDTVDTVADDFTEISPKGRWCRIRVKNTHGADAFSAHSTEVSRDMGTSGG